MQQRPNNDDGAPATVLYLAGAGRSGGTMIGKVLGQHQRMLYTGELRELRTPGLLVDRLCGCGTRLIDCDFWQAVFKAAYGGLAQIDARWMNEMRLKHTRTRQTPAWLLRWRSNSMPEDLKQFARLLEYLYRSLCQVTGKPVIVDASRSVAYGRILEHIPSLDLRVVHLIRDARAVVFSWGRRRTGTTATRQVELARKPVLRAAVEWAAQNLLVEMSWGRYPAHYRRLRYEDFILRPRQETGRLLRWLGQPEGDLAFIGDGTAQLGVDHSAAGNTYRLALGPTPLRLDDEWRTKMPARDRALVEMMTWPLLKRYGYPLATQGVSR